MASKQNLGDSQGGASDSDDNNQMRNPSDQ